MSKETETLFAFSRITLAWRAAARGYWAVDWSWLAHGRPF